MKGTLTSTHSTVSYYKDINTLKELDASGLHIDVASGSLGDIFDNDFGNPTIQSLKSKYHVHKNTVDYLNQVANARNTCTIERLNDIHITIAVSENAFLAFVFFFLIQ